MREDHWNQTEIQKCEERLRIDLFQMEPFSQRIMACFTHFLETNPAIDELRKSVYQMIFAFVTRPDSLQALNKAAG